MPVRKTVSAVDRLPYAGILFVWTIFLAPISLGIFTMTSPYGTPLGLPGILLLWAVMVGSMTDEDPNRIDWKKRFHNWIVFPLIATFIQALIFGSSLWLSVVFLNAWFLMSRAWAAFGKILWEAADQKDWKEFRKTLFIFLTGAPVLMILYLPVTFTVVMSIVDSTSRLAGTNEVLKKILLAFAILGLLADIVFQSRPYRLRHENLSN